MREARVQMLSPSLSALSWLVSRYLLSSFQGAQTWFSYTLRSSKQNSTQRRIQLCSKAGKKSNWGWEKSHKNKQGAWRVLRREGGGEHFSCEVSQLRFSLGSTNFYSKQAGKSNFVCLFPPLQKSIQPSGRLSCCRQAGLWTVSSTPRPGLSPPRGRQEVVSGFSGKNNAAFISRCSLTARTRKKPWHANPGARGSVARSPIP